MDGLEVPLRVARVAVEIEYAAVVRVRVLDVLGAIVMKGGCNEAGGARVVDCAEPAGIQQHTMNRTNIGKILVKRYVLDNIGKILVKRDVLDNKTGNDKCNGVKASWS